VNWPDLPGPAGTRLVFEGASSFAVSNRGKTYTFVVRRGLRFSDGSPVTARSFAYAIDRTANKRNRRLAAFGKLDLDISRNLAPVAPMRTFNNRYLFSNRVEPRSLVWNSVYGDWSIPELALK
jgi:ABC-type transport system substrate-binding protein